MQDKGDFFIVMPGGLGTLEEAIETWNAIKIGEIDKKMGFLNINGFFDYLFCFISNCEKNGFLSSKQKFIPEIEADIKILLHKLDEKNTALEIEEFSKVQQFLVV